MPTFVVFKIILHETTLIIARRRIAYFSRYS